MNMPMALRLPLRPHLSAGSLQQKLLVSFCWLAALALTAWIGAGWYWRLQASPTQSSVAVAAADPQVAAQEVASRQIFGLPPAPVAAAGAAPVSSIVVIGVQTRWGKLPGYAILRDGSNPSQSLVEGESLAGGIKLIRVRADGIEVDRNGSTEFIALNGITPANQGAATATPVAPQTPQNAPVAAAPATPAPPPPVEKDKGD